MVLVQPTQQSIGHLVLTLICGTILIADSTEFPSDYTIS